MYTEADMKKALGKKRWEWIADYDWNGETIDILFKLPMTTMQGTTCYVNQPFENEMTKAEVVEEIKFEMDTATTTWDECPYHPDGTHKTPYHPDNTHKETA